MWKLYNSPCKGITKKSIVYSTSPVSCKSNFTTTPPSPPRVSSLFAQLVNIADSR